MQILSKSILKRGFTLIEMVVTLSIIAILAVVITTQFNGDSAKATKIMNDVVTIKKAVLRYKMDVGRYPNCLEQLWKNTAGCGSTPGPSNWSGPYLDKMTRLSHPLYDYSHVVDGAWIALQQHSAGLFNAPYPNGHFAIDVAYIPSGVASKLMKMCNGVDLIGAGQENDFSNGNCGLTDASETGAYLFSFFVAKRS